jgi:VWFA-related protein
VRDERGNTVTGLTKDDFIVTEDNQRQQIQHFSLGNDLTVGRTIVLLIDYSDSQTPYIETSVEAAKMLVDQLGPKDIMAIVTDDVELLVDFTRDKDKLRKGLDSLSKKVKWFQVGRSKQFSALMATVKEMFTIEDIRRIIIFQTDGDEVEVLHPTTAPVVVPTFRGDRLKDSNLLREFALREFSLRDVYQAVEKSRASVYTVIPGPPLLDGFNEKVKTSRFSEFRRRGWHRAAAGAAIGGWTAYLQKPEEATNIYSRILADINSRYVIGYYPTNKVHDGKRRQVLIEARDHPEYSITGRKTYIAPDPEP